MRHYSYFDQNEIFELAEEGIDDSDPFVSEGVPTDEDFREAFGKRTFEICEADNKILAEKAGINIRSLRAAFENLRECDMIRPMDEKWKIYLTPYRYYKREYMNRKLTKEVQDVV